MKESKLESKGKSVPKILGLNNKESLSVTTSMGQVRDSWFLNYGSSYHMLVSRDLFDTYKPYAGGDNAKLASIGIETIKIWMFDGIVRTLTAVMHVLGLQRNLVFLGALNSKGCKCTTVCGVVELWR